MSEASTFATAATSAPTTVDTTLNVNVSDDRSSGSDTLVGDLLYTYQDEAKHPYTAKYLGIENVWNKEPVLKSEVDLLESYLRKMVVDKKIDNNVSSAKKYLEYLEGKAGIEPFESTTIRVAKLLKYINFRKVVDS